MARVLAIDAGFQAIGYAVIEDNKVLLAGAHKTSKASKKRGIRVADDDAERCQDIARHLDGICKEWKPVGVIVELPGGGAKAARANRAMGMATGVVATFIWTTGLPAEWVTPQEAKKAVTGSKNASKEEVQRAVIELFNWTIEKPNTKWKLEHSCDALAAAKAAENGALMKTIKTMERQG